MDHYENRSHAGQVLASLLTKYAGRQDAIVLALPRGGVPVGYEISVALSLPLDVLIVRKLGVPSYSELAMGAIASGDVTVFNDEIISSQGIQQPAIQAVIEAEKIELKRREQRYRHNRPWPVLKDKIIILVDDGIATGATIRAAIKALKQQQPRQLIVAVPVADKAVIEELLQLVDTLVCPLQPNRLNAVGQWYTAFEQTSDDEVIALLESVLSRTSSW